MAAWTVHGGQLAAARRRWPNVAEPWLDLSTGINPHAWPIARAGRIDWQRLPENEDLAGLEAAAAAAFGVPAETVCATPGSEIALRLLGALDLPRPHRFVAPGYSTHAALFADGIAVQPEAIVAIGDGTLVMARPANPQGALWPLPSDLVRLILDEAFADAMPPAPEPARAGVIALRSFGKFFGLAGVRLGFVIASAGQITRLRHLMGSWPVSAAAIAIGTAAYRDTAWQARMRDRLARETRRLDRVLARHGLIAEGACPLFRLVRTADALGLFERLAAQGILTRPFESEREWLRFGLPGSAAALARLDRALG